MLKSCHFEDQDLHKKYQKQSTNFDSTYVPDWQPSDWNLSSTKPLPPFNELYSDEDIFPRDNPPPTPMKFAPLDFSPLEASDILPTRDLSSSQHITPKSSRRDLRHLEIAISPPAASIKFKTPLEAVAGAIEQIRIAKLGLGLSVGTWKAFENELSSLEKNLKRTYKILTNQFPPHKAVNNHIILIQKSKISSDLNSWMSSAAKLINLINQKLQEHGRSRPTLCEDLKDLKEQIENIQKIFTDRIVRI